MYRQKKMSLPFALQKCQQFKVVMVSLYQFMYREKHGAKLIMLGVSWRNVANTSYLLTEVDIYSVTGSAPRPLHQRLFPRFPRSHSLDF